MMFRVPAPGDAAGPRHLCGWGVSAEKVPGRINLATTRGPGDEAHDDSEAAADGPSFPTPDAGGDNALLGAAARGGAGSTQAIFVRSASSA